MLGATFGTFYTVWGPFHWILQLIFSHLWFDPPDSLAPLKFFKKSKKKSKFRKFQKKFQKKNRICFGAVERTTSPTTPELLPVIVYEYL